MSAGRQVDDDAVRALDAHWARLMSLAQGGDQAAYRELLRDIVPLLRAAARRHHRNFDRAEDVVQEILLTVHRVRHTYDPSRSFRNWVLCIARRRSIDALRRYGRIAAHENPADPEVLAQAAADPNPDDGHREAGPALARAIAALPPGQRKAIELVKLRELSLLEASASSGLSVGALKVNVHRALKNLRAHFAGP